MWNANRPTPTATLDTFCQALLNRDNHTAYLQFSPNLSSRISEATFTGTLSKDPVTACNHGSANPSGNRVLFALQLVHESGGQNNDVATLVQQSDGAWKIDALQRQ
jgi:hypothetical protein